MALFNDIYATKEQYADYTGLDLSSLPSDIDSKLKRASRLITMIISGYSETNENHIEATMLATCSQVEFWYLNQDNTLTPNDFTELELGDFRIKKGTSMKELPTGMGVNYVNDFAKGFLLRAGLLYRGVSFRRSNEYDNNTINALD